MWKRGIQRSPSLLMRSSRQPRNARLQSHSLPPACLLDSISTAGSPSPLARNLRTLRPPEAADDKVDGWKETAGQQSSHCFFVLFPGQTRAGQRSPRENVLKAASGISPLPARLLYLTQAGWRPTEWCLSTCSMPTEATNVEERPTDLIPRMPCQVLNAHETHGTTITACWVNDNPTPY